jgi:hypothetical protein
VAKISFLPDDHKLDPKKMKQDWIPISKYIIFPKKKKKPDFRKESFRIF